MSSFTAPSLRADQARILAGGVLAAGVIGVSAWAVLKAGPQPAASGVSAFGLAARWFALPAACLLVGVLVAALFRYTHREDISGASETASHAFEINLRYNRNTCEQLILAFASWMAFAASCPAWASMVFPRLAALFVLGRATFWVGYLAAPWARAFGFVLTLAPSAILLALTLADLV